MALIVRRHKEGKQQQVIARLVQCSQAGVSKVLTRYRSGGKAPGKAAYLTGKQLEKLTQMLVKGALHHGFPTDKWTRERMASLIEQQFAVHYHPSHTSLN